MRRLTFAVAFFMFFASQLYAQPRLKLGLQVGQMKVAKNSFTLEKNLNGSHFGGHVILSIIPQFDLVLMANYFKKTFPGSPGPEPTENEYTHMAYDLSLRYKLALFPLLIKPYWGAGVGWHSIKLSEKGVAGKGTLPEQNESDTSVLVLAGLAVEPPIIPLCFFLEGKYAYVLAAGESYDVTSAYVGISYIF